jgi:hypothetical protein
VGGRRAAQDEVRRAAARPGPSTTLGMTIGVPSVVSGSFCGARSRAVSRHLVFVFALVIAATSLHAATRGRLCVAGAACVEHTCGERVTPSDGAALPYTFETPESVVLGVLARGATDIACTASGTLRLRVGAGSGKSRITITRRGGETVWDIQPNVRQLAKGLAIRAERGEYDVAIQTPHFITARRHITLGESAEQLAIALEPLPTLSGLVLSRGTGRPVAGAMIITDTPDLVTADPTGHFAIEADPEKWPTKLTVSAAAYAESTVIPPRARVSVKLDDIYLSIGGSISVELTGNPPGEPMHLELQKPTHSRVPGAPFRSLEPPALTFDGVEPGTYIVLAKGAKPGQRRGQQIELLEGERRTVRLDIKPFTVHVRAAMNGDPLAHANAVMEDHEAHWEARFETDANGEASLELWQGGKAELWLAAPKLMTAPYVEKRALTEGEDVDWNVDVPSREIVGTVVDSRTGEPVPNAGLALYASAADSGLGVHTRADEHGRFRFAPVQYGNHRLKAAARDYSITEMNYVFVDPEQRRELAVRLDRAAKLRVTVVDARGTPVAGARVIQYHGFVSAGAGETDVSGEIDIPVAQDETREVFVIPRDGSIAVAQVRAGEPQTIRVADGTSRIIVRIETDSHAPLPGVFAIVRYDGHVLPREVVQALAVMQGARVSSGGDGRIVFDHMPPGAYEFWPVDRPEDVDLATTSTEAPARMIAMAGENTAILTFSRIGKP